MGFNWTKEQQNVIDFRNRNILVSAAAGSGKTAVLVERIIKRITDSENPVDIDKIIVVTFTNAAAAEMRERITNAINKKKEENPDDENLDRQMTLIHNAQISTIDSFCLYVVRNYFEKINLDPDFRIGDNGELQLLENDVMDALFEKNYARENNEMFLRLVDSYAEKGNDSNIKKMVLDIFRKSQSDSWPKEWIENIRTIYEVKSKEDFLKTEFMGSVVNNIRNTLIEFRYQLEYFLEIAKEPDGPDKYIPRLENDLILFENVEELDSYNKLYDFINNLDMGSLAPARAYKGDVQKRDAVKSGRKSITDDLKKIKKQYFSLDLENVIEQLKRLSPIVAELSRLALEFTEDFEAEKREKRVASFNDVEHFALKIFVDEKTKECTDTANEFKKNIEEIMIDEYQDSNQVQEDIMRAISRESIGENNMFMVGDVKQSIYRFRLARPELFMDKYNKYDSEKESTNQRIDLHNNFRSRREVIDFANDIFEKIMRADLGNVEYDDAAALRCGAQYSPNEGMEPEILLVDENDELLTELNIEEKSHKLEARVIAAKINKMMKENKVQDKETNELRPIRYSDIVILLRGTKSHGMDYVSVLEENGIPAYVESQTGYFSSYEIQTILNMLSILDNPYQDIPMTAVLKSPIVGLDDEELAEIRINNPDEMFSKAVINIMKTAEEGKLYEFNKIYTKLRSEVQDTQIHELIQHLLDYTGFEKYAASMPAGKRRLQNILMLIEKAISYESTSYKGLFHFIRYIEQLRKYDIDFGEADVLGENANVVRIMTIHKSKGLEFPIVFVSNLNKGFNKDDTKGGVVLHPTLGIGINEYTMNPRVKKDCIIRSELSSMLEKETLGEELRVLYVALTRAKEKIILTGVITDKEKFISGYVGNVKKGAPISFAKRLKAKSFLDWIIPAVISYPDKYEVQYADIKELVISEVEKNVDNESETKQIIRNIENVDDSLVDKLTAKFDFEYKYKSDLGRKSKYSVSELKHDSMLQKYDMESGEIETPDFLLREKTPYIPKFARKPSENFSDIIKEKTGMSKASLRGIAVHRVMECIDFAEILEIDTKDDGKVKKFVKGQLDFMLQSNEITDDMYKLLNIKAIESFVKSDVAQRMALADSKGELFREKPFVMEYNEVLVQGIIDVFWYEGDNIVILDYKTDYVDDSQELVVRYSKQLELYADAVNRLYGNDKVDNKMNVSERLIYSFRLQEAINI